MQNFICGKISLLFPQTNQHCVLIYPHGHIFHFQLHRLTVSARMNLRYPWNLTTSFYKGGNLSLACGQMQETQVQSHGQEDSLEKGMATHSSILAWRIPWTEEPSGL